MKTEMEDLYKDICSKRESYMNIRAKSNDN